VLRELFGVTKHRNTLTACVFVKSKIFCSILTGRCRQFRYGSQDAELIAFSVSGNGEGEAKNLNYARTETLF
jgi:hypothetical protein